MHSNDTLNAILKSVIIGGIFLLPFIPFIVSKSMFFPFITGKNFAFRIIIEIIFAGWIVLLWRDATYRLKFSWIVAALAVFVGVVTLADIFGKDFLRSFWSNYERMDGLITLLHLFAFFMVAGSVMNTKLLWERFLQTSLAASVIISIYGIFQLLGKIVINQGGVRVDATLGNATYLAGYLLFHIFFAALLFAQKNTPNWLRVLYGAIIALNVFMLFNTMTRGALLALLGGVTLTAFLAAFFDGDSRALKKYAVGALVGIFLAVGIFVAIKDANFVKKSDIFGRLADISLEAGKSRFLVWGMAWEAVKERPLLGWGQDNFIFAFSTHYDPRMYTEEPWFDRAHNIVLDWLIAGGALGLLSYFAVFCALIYALWFYPFRKTSEEDEHEHDSQEFFSVFEKSVLAGLFTGYLFHNLFVFDNVVSYLLFFSVIALVHFRTTETPPVALKWLRIRIQRKELVDQLIPSLVLIALLFSLYVFNVKSILGNHALLRGMNLSAAQKINSPEDREPVLRGNLRSFQKSIESGYLGRTEAREQLVQITNNLFEAPVSQIMKQEFFTLAHTEMKKQKEETPQNLRTRMFIGSLLLRYRLFDEAILEFEDARAISDKKQDMQYLLANSYFNIGNTEKALETAKRAFELERSNVRALKIYASFLIRAEHTALAEELLGTISKDEYLLDPDIVNAYASVGRFDQLIVFREEQIKKNPENLEAYISLSATYLELGERGKAIAELERATQLFPQFKEQGEFFIREIKAGRKP